MRGAVESAQNQAIEYLSLENMMKKLEDLHPESLKRLARLFSYGSWLPNNELTAIEKILGIG